MEGEVETKIFSLQVAQSLGVLDQGDHRRSILEQVDSDGWVLLSITEQHHYGMWRAWKWGQLEEKDFL